MYQTIDEMKHEATQITIYRKFTEEAMPRFSAVSGKSFDELLTAVKALPFRQYEAANKMWKIKTDGLNTLKAQGLTVEALPYMVVDVASLYPGSGKCMQVDLMRRNKEGGFVRTCSISMDVSDTYAGVSASTPKTQEMRARLEAIQNAVNEAVKPLLGKRTTDDFKTAFQAGKTAFLQFGLEA